MYHYMQLYNYCVVCLDSRYLPNLLARGVGVYNTRHLRRIDVLMSFVNCTNIKIKDLIGVFSYISGCRALMSFTHKQV